MGGVSVSFCHVTSHLKLSSIKIYSFLLRSPGQHSFWLLSTCHSSSLQIGVRSDSGS